jgi:hypothetical protein
MKKRTMSTELRAIANGFNEAPPPAPPTASIREWFAGLALMNPTLMQDFAPGDRAKEAVRLADELMFALQSPRVPHEDLMRDPKADIVPRVAVDPQHRPTNPEGIRPPKTVSPTVPSMRPPTMPAGAPSPSMRAATVQFGAVLPPPATMRPKALVTGHRGLPAQSSYSRMGEGVDDE